MTQKKKTKSNEEYWAERTAEAQLKRSDMNANEVNKVLKKYYKNCSTKVIKEFQYTYNKIWEQIVKGEEPSPALLYKLDTYWEFQKEIRDELNKLGEIKINKIEKSFVNNFFDVYKALSLESETAYKTIDRRGALELINSVWCADGKSWSRRIWEDTELLYKRLNDGLVRSIVTGISSDELKLQLMKDFNTSYQNAKRIVNTEMAHVQTEAAKQRYKDYGYKMVEVWADEDERRCEHCGQLHEKKFPVDGQMPIPAHPNCRCCIIPVVDRG